jgi:hypothetical protein
MAVTARACIRGQICDEQVTVTAEQLAIFCVSHELLDTEYLSVDKHLLVGFGTLNFVQ